MTTGALQHMPVRASGRAAPAVALRILTIALASIACSAPLAVEEFTLPRPNVFPHDPAVGRDGIVWYTDQANSFIGRLDPATGKVTDYETPTPKSGPHGITVGPDGSVWYTANRVGKLGRLDPATGKITEYAIGARDPHTLVFSKGLVWFTVQQGNQYGRLDPATGKSEVWKVATPRALPYGIVPTAGGDLWVALFGTNKIAHVVGQTGEMHEIALPNADARPRRLAVGSDGKVWYTDYARGYLGMVDPSKPAMREFASPGGPRSGPYGIAIGTDGRIWYDESGTGTMVAFDPKTERMETIAIPTKGSIVRHMVTDSTRSTLWLALSGTGRIGRIKLPGAK
jgi:virginiamycin B lyase